MAYKSLKQFVSDNTGKVLDVEPGWGWPGECVSLVQRYVIECFGLSAEARGNGIDFGNTLVRAGQANYVNLNEMRYGDIVCWGGFAEGGVELGHVAVVLHDGKVFDQSTGQRRTAQARTPIPNMKYAVRMKAALTPDSNGGSSSNGFKSYSATIPAGATLYDANGTAYPAKTTVAHDVTVTGEKGGMSLFSASWLQGVDHAYFKSGSKPSQPSQPSKPAANYRDRKGSTVTIAGSALLYDANGTPYSLRVTNDKRVTVTGQIGNGIDGSTLLRFSASWLIGVSEAYVRLENVY